MASEGLNIADYFLVDRLREGRGDRVAVRTDDGDLTYAEIDRLANRFGNALRQAGVRPEERVLVALPDSPVFAAALFGVLKLGAVVVMVNPALPRENLAPIIGYSRASAIVLDGWSEATFREARADARRDPSLLVVDDEAPRASGKLSVVPTHRDDPAIWLFSGGTTGRPKAAVQTHRAFANATELYAKRAVGYREDDRTLSVPRLHFGYATGANLLFPFAVGACAILSRTHPTADVVFEQIQRHRPTILVNVPKMIRDMVDHPDAKAQDLSSLRFAISAGEALPAVLYERWRDTFGVELYDGLGTAEMWHIFVSNLPGAVRPGTIGRAVPGYDVRVRDDDGLDVEDGKVGRLWVSGHSRALSYWQDMPRTKDVFRGEWAVLGDLVRRDEDGFITYVGRADEALKVGGKWLLPAEVEACLATHPAVRECAVVGVPDEGGLTKPVAFVVPGHEGGGDLEETLKQHVLAALDAYKHPRRVHRGGGPPRARRGAAARGAPRRPARGPRPRPPPAAGGPPGGGAG
jgi:benzoate-CoA ligase family protein